VIGFDTNVLVRFFTRDDPDRARLAKQAIESCTEVEPGFVSMVVLAELHWVLRHTYRYDAEAALGVVEGLFAARELMIEGEETVSRALRMARKGADFADALIGDTADLLGCDRVVTFDRRAARHKPFVLLED